MLSTMWEPCRQFRSQRCKAAPAESRGASLSNSSAELCWPSSAARAAPQRTVDELQRLRSSSGSLHSPGGQRTAVPMPLFGSKKKAAAEAEAAAAAAADGEGKKKKLTRKEKEKVGCATALPPALRGRV